VVWLHGAGGDERQLDRVIPHVSLRNYAAVGPRAAGAVWEQTHAGIAHAERVIFESIEAAASRLNVAPQRIFLAGYQDGGVMALRVALRHPRRFAGAATLCGPFPRGLHPLACWKELRNLSLMLMYGREGRTYSIEAMCRDLELFHTAGLQVALRQYPCGDEITTTMLNDLDAWIMEQVTGESILDRDGS
jgi:phospholipase/carboxylesterase